MTEYSNIFATVLGRVQAATDALIASGALPALDLARVVVEPPREPRTATRHQRRDGAGQGGRA